MRFHLFIGFYYLYNKALQKDNGNPDCSGEGEGGSLSLKNQTGAGSRWPEKPGGGRGEGGGGVKNSCHPSGIWIFSGIRILHRLLEI